MECFLKIEFFVLFHSCVTPFYITPRECRHRYPYCDVIQQICLTAQSHVTQIRLSDWLCSKVIQNIWQSSWLGPELSRLGLKVVPYTTTSE